MTEPRDVLAAAHATAILRLVRGEEPTQLLFPFFSSIEQRETPRLGAKVIEP